jgi:hypothetical protein
MQTRSRRFSTLGAVVIVALGLAACGGGGSNEVVAQVTGVGKISKATLEHWMPVEAVVIYKEYPTSPVPKGVIPDPPDYTACAAFLKAAPPQFGESGAKPTPAQLKSKCAQKQSELKELTLNTLIGWYWIIAAGLALGMKASDTEISAWLVKGNKMYFPKPGAFTRYLKLTGQTKDDMLFRAKVQVFESKLLAVRTAIEKRLPKGATDQQRRTALAGYVASLPPARQWVERTSCRKGFVVSACKQYRGSNPPGIPN